MTLSSSLKLQLMKLVNMFPVLVAKIPLVVMEFVIKIKIMLSLPYIVQHLAYVYNLCISHNRFPSDLKTAKVVPLPKAKDLTDINNYRPISVLSSVSKPLEKHVHKYLLKYLDRFNLIHTHQSGLRPQHSCQSALTCLVDRLLSSVNKSVEWCCLFRSKKKEKKKRKKKSL